MILIPNKKARFEYVIDSTFMAGVVLSGGEVKSLRKQSGSLTGSFVKILGGEAFLLNAQITPYSRADNREYDPKRTRKLLLTKKELEKLQVASDQKGIVLVPLAFELKGKHIKVSIGLGRGKKQFERRADLKKRAVERDVARELKQKVRL
jgi:SsrA-binding protein